MSKPLTSPWRRSPRPSYTQLRRTLEVPLEMWRDGGVERSTRAGVQKRRTFHLSSCTCCSTLLPCTSTSSVNPTPISNRGCNRSQPGGPSWNSAAATATKNNSTPPGEALARISPSTGFFPTRLTRVSEAAPVLLLELVDIRIVEHIMLDGEEVTLETLEEAETDLRSEIPPNQRFLLASKLAAASAMQHT